MNQYESLDMETRENFNKKFISQLEQKGGIAIGEILEDFIDETESQQMVENIFPSAQFGEYNNIYGVTKKQDSQDYNSEIE